MAIEAPISKFKKSNLLIYIGICVIFAAWFGYDGYLNKSFIEKQTENGKPNTTLMFNQKSPPFFLAGAILCGIYFYMVKGRKLLAGETELVINDKKKISYDSIEKINKTWFEKKGFFVVTYKNENGKETDYKISDRQYDNLENILNHLVEKIS
ncbi:MAG: hypothetical protein JXA96_07630 [Sedimentisphaerales bacterium]|nr:hypothetical protein [Sedimentisphaerales bacterium]